MGRKGATHSPASSKSENHPAGTGWRRSFTLRRGAFVLVVLMLLSIAGFALFREVSPTGPVAARDLPRPQKPAKPAFTPAEEAYIQALWPIHGQVERSAARMALGQIFYTINELDRPSLKKRIDDALLTYRRSEARLRELTPPASIQRDHEEYLSAIELFQKSAVEVLRMFEDGREEHMLAAYPLGQKATDKIREVGGKFWPNEFAPN